MALDVEVDPVFDWLFDSVAFGFLVRLSLTFETVVLIESRTCLIVVLVAVGLRCLPPDVVLVLSVVSDAASVVSAAAGVSVAVSSAFSTDLVACAVSGAAVFSPATSVVVVVEASGSVNTGPGIGLFSGLGTNGAHTAHCVPRTNGLKSVLRPFARLVRLPATNCGVTGLISEKSGVLVRLL